MSRGERRFDDAMLQRPLLNVALVYNPNSQQSSTVLDIFTLGDAVVSKILPCSFVTKKSGS